MILYASQRGRSAELAAHLLNGDQNDHVAVHDIRGFVSEDLAEALREAYAISRGTRCKQFLFSVSLNPPEDADVPIEDFEAAIEMIEKKMGLLHQPRIIVFHEKNGRRHCHAVWSRIDADKLTAINMAHFKRKLMEVSKILFLQHGWKLPKGFQKKADKNPFNMTREEHRQAVRLLEDPLAMKGMFKNAWEQSDSAKTFARALEEFGLYLAKGDKRGYVAVDLKGGIYSLTRWLDIGTRDLKSRLGPPEGLPSLERAKQHIAERMTENVQRYVAEAKTSAAEQRTPLVREVRALVLAQRTERRELIETQKQRWKAETKQRMARIPKGVRGVWQKVSGGYKAARMQNEKETKVAIERDRKELHALVRSHLHERQELQKTVKFYKEEQKQEVARIKREASLLLRAEDKHPALPQATAAIEKVPLAAQLAQLEVKIGLLSGDMSQLQASLESNLLSDETRGRIRILIEKTMEALQLKAIETKEELKAKIDERTKELQERQDLFNTYVLRYAELQLEQEKETRQIAARNDFYRLISNMSFALNGMPTWQINVMSPPIALDERVYTAKVQQRSHDQLLDRVFKSPENESQVAKRPPVDPKNAVPNLRSNILEVKEMMIRAGINPRGGKSAVAPSLPLNTAIKFNVTTAKGLK